ncbi:hypothetical protein [Candidatus Gromoviella agglomerans]|uniref:hypothetical protein n=1 Tax=Candidatus Gromoviella agglomerans TaxID=2806609 RepID=UPI001E608B2F|nr:hypothetical protein [Candidatus Gromoviella agglomerans]UFX98527.1 DnaA regulatory inactivator Hda [Candidatus Gromoviella agglomerans]
MNFAQNFFDLTFEPNFTRDSFFTDESNHHVLEWIDSTNTNIILLSGIKSSGKTHLSKIWASKFKITKLISFTEFCDSPIDKLYSSNADAYILDNIQEIFLNNSLYIKEFEEKMLHFYNYIISSTKKLLILTDTTIYSTNFGLKDLLSRINSTCSMDIPIPSDKVLQMVIRKLFRDYGVSASDSTVDFISSRIDRSFNTAVEIANIINNESIRQNSPISIPFLRQNCIIT